MMFKNTKNKAILSWHCVSSSKWILEEQDDDIEDSIFNGEEDEDNDSTVKENDRSMMIIPEQLMKVLRI